MGTKNQKIILAISKDEGWKQFADTTGWIDVEPDLPAALQMLQQHAERAEAFVIKIVKNAANGGGPELLQALERWASNGLANFTPYAEASSYHEYDAQDVQVELISIDFPTVDKEGTPDVYVVRVGNEEIVFQVGVWIEAKAEADFTFQIYDSIDKDYVSLGAAHASIDTSFSSSLLVTIIGDFFADEPVYDVDSVELLDIPRSIDFDEVNPDFSNDRD